MSRPPGPLMIDFAGPELTAVEREMLAHPEVGGAILFARNYEAPAQLAALVASIRAARPEVLIAVDYEGGRVQRFREGFTRLPPMRRLGELYDSDPAGALAAAHSLGWLIGDELGGIGIDLPLAPVLDLDYGCAAVIGDRACHSDPEAVIAIAGAVRWGLAAAGVSATGKHFPGHGGVAEDSHDELPVDEREESALEAHLRPFAALIGQGLESVMMAHIRFPAVDDAPASLSGAWIRDRLRRNLGFTGAVFCDDLSMGGAAAAGDYPDRAWAALEAGCDILPVCNNPGAVERLLDSPAAPADPAAVERRRALARRRPDKGKRPPPETLRRLAALTE